MDLKERVQKRVDDIADGAWDMALDMHKNPELGHQEHRAAELLSSALQSEGFQVQRQVAGMETSFYSEYRFGEGAGPKVAVLAEYDALPGMGHACGHNIIGAAAVGAGIALKKAISEADTDLSGTIVVLGCPAEEGAVDGAGGKVDLVEHGYLDDVDCAMMIHPSTKNISRSSSLAREALEISYHGKSSHAAATPEKGKNALDAAILTFNNWNALRQHVRDDVRIHGVITEGGQAPNIVPDFAQIRMYARSQDSDYLQEVVEKVKDCARGAATAAGCEVAFRPTAKRYANLAPNEMLADAYVENFEILGEPIDEQTTKGSGSTDMGNVSQVTPSIHPYVAIAPDWVAGHSTEMEEAAASEEGRKGMTLGAKAMAMTAIDVLTGESFRKNMKDEFCSE